MLARSKRFSMVDSMTPRSPLAIPWKQLARLMKATAAWMLFNPCNQLGRKQAHPYRRSSSDASCFSGGIIPFPATGFSVFPSDIAIIYKINLPRSLYCAHTVVPARCAMMLFTIALRQSRFIEISPRLCRLEARTRSHILRNTGHISLKYASSFVLELRA